MDIDITGFYRSQKTGFWYRIDDPAGNRYSIITCDNCKKKVIKKYNPNAKWRACSSTCAIEYRAGEKEERFCEYKECWKLFTVLKTSSRRFCSKDCSDNSMRKVLPLCRCGCGEGVTVKSKTGYKRTHWMRNKEGKEYLEWKIKHKAIHGTSSSKVNKILAGWKKGGREDKTLSDAWRRYRRIKYYQGHQCLCGCREVVTYPDRRYATADCLTRHFRILMKDPKYKKEHIKKSKRWLADPEKRQRCLEGGRKGLQNCFSLPTKPELKMRRFLDYLYPGEYKYVGDGSRWVGRMNPDFISINGVRQVIEVFGDYWHRGENPIWREWEFKEKGYSCLVIWEREINEGNGWKRKVRRFHDSIRPGPF